MRQVVEAVRDRLAQADLSAAHLCFSSFPRGACGAACDLLATVLGRRFGVFPYWVSRELGEGEDWSLHAWLEVGDMTIDITADQFGAPAVIVSKQSDWHQSLQITQKVHYLISQRTGVLSEARSGASSRIWPTRTNAVSPRIFARYCCGNLALGVRQWYRTFAVTCRVRLEDMMIKMTGSHALKVRWSEYKFYMLPAVQAVLTLGCYAAGYQMSSTGDGMPMARAGALATAISVGFTLWSYGDILRDGNQMSKDQFGRLVDSMNLDPRRALAAKDSYGRKLDGQTGKINRVITTAHAAILIVATLVWGFGDLVSEVL